MRRSKRCWLRGAALWLPMPQTGRPRRVAPTTKIMKFSVIENAQDNQNAKRELRAQIISAYSGVIRLYAFVRFKIIHLRFLEEIEQYLPNAGTILDLGCGFGLFSLYMAACKPNARVIGLDINARRLQIARNAAEKLGIATFHSSNTICATGVPIKRLPARTRSIFFIIYPLRAAIVC